IAEPGRENPPSPSGRGQGEGLKVGQNPVTLTRRAARAGLSQRHRRMLQFQHMRTSRRHSFFIFMLVLQGCQSAQETKRPEQSSTEADNHAAASPTAPPAATKLLDGMGKVNFPITTNSPEAQAFFNQGVAQLYGFWFIEAERSFQQAAKLDPRAAMAYWGIA